MRLFSLKPHGCRIDLNVYYHCHHEVLYPRSHTTRGTYLYQTITKRSVHPDACFLMTPSVSIVTKAMLNLAHLRLVALFNKRRFCLILTKLTRIARHYNASPSWWCSDAKNGGLTSKAAVFSVIKTFCVLAIVTKAIKICREALHHCYQADTSLTGDCQWTGKPFILSNTNTNTKVNSAFYFSEVGKSSGHRAVCLRLKRAHLFVFGGK